MVIHFGTETPYYYCGLLHIHVSIIHHSIYLQQKKTQGKRYSKMETKTQQKTKKMESKTQQKTNKMETKTQQKNNKMETTEQKSSI